MTEPIDLDRETAEYAAAQQREYGKWEAAEVITVGSAPAYNVGDPVPISNVERLGYAERGQVRLQAAYVDDNPDDDDVQTFKAYAEKYPDAPAAKEYEAYRARRAAEEKSGDHLPPLTFGGGKAKARKATTAKTESSKADSGDTTTKKG